jgi:hypothetical protein
MIHLPHIKKEKEGMPLEMMNSKMISLESALKCLIQVKDNTFLCYLKYRFGQDCYNENYFLDTQSKKQRMSISGQEKEAKLNKTGKHCDHTSLSVSMLLIELNCFIEFYF